MTKKLRILSSSATNPWFNLATENWIFKELDPDCLTLFLWRNTDTVVIGRYQNPWMECKTSKMEEDNVYLARRESGGGAVYHDLGNTNFTFLSPKKDYDQEANFKIIINALENLGIHAHKSGRNDLLVDDQKISGSAFKYAKDRCFHHGTLLVNADLTKLANYLNPHPLKLESKAIKSVRSRVTNLVQINESLSHEIICKEIINSFCAHYNIEQPPVEVLDESILTNNDALKKYYNMMSDWDWRFGKTPKFNHKLETRFDWGLIELNIDVDSAVIKDTLVYSDALNVDLIAALQEHLIGVEYKPSAIFQLMDLLAEKNSDWHKELSDIKNWLKEEIK